MSTKYCDHLAYGAYVAVPTWGAAQDGDGTATTPGTPSTAEIVFTGVPSSGVINVLGVPVTVTWATSATNCANLLATAINALATVAVGPASFTTKSQVRNHLYARGPANGAPANTCQIMTRQASADHAGLIAITHTLNNVSSGGTINFAGGSGGCWGWLVNGEAATIWPSGVAQTAYGLWGSSAQYCGTTLPGDKIIVRAKAVNLNAANNWASLNLHDMGTPQNPVRFVVDDGTVWPDGPNPVLWLRSSGTTYGYYLFSAFTSVRDAYATFEGKTYSDGTRSLKFSHTQANSSLIYTRSNVTMTGVEFWPEAATGGTSFTGGYETVAPRSISGLRLLDCKLYATTNATPFLQTAQYANNKLTLEGCVIQAGPGITTAYIGFIGGHNGSYSLHLLLRGVTFSGFVTGSKFLQSTAALPPRTCIQLQNCDLGNVTDFTPNLSSSSFNFMADRSQSRYISMTSAKGTRDFFHETQNGLVRWTALRYPPYCNATLLDTGTGWVLEATPATIAEQIAVNEPLKTPPMAKINSLESGARTLTAQLAIDTRLAWTTGDVALVVQYTDTTGALQRLSSHNLDRNVLTASTAAWSSESGGLVTFGANSSTLNKYQISLSTPVGADLPLAAQINCHFEFYTSVPDVTHITLIDPEVIIA